MSEQVKDTDGEAIEAPEQEELTALLKKVEELQSEAADYKDKYLRSVADLDNVKKRSFREREELRKLLITGFLEELLPVLDGFNVGLESASKHPETQKVAQGFQMVSDQFSHFFKRYEVQEINPEDGTFDPNFHECVTQTPSNDIPEGNIVEVIRVGYSIKERLIRPATVVVSSGPAKTE